MQLKFLKHIPEAKISNNSYSHPRKIPEQQHLQDIPYNVEMSHRTRTTGSADGIIGTSANRSQRSTCEWERSCARVPNTLGEAWVFVLGAEGVGFLLLTERQGDFLLLFFSQRSLSFDPVQSQGPTHLQVTSEPRFLLCVTQGAGMNCLRSHTEMCHLTSPRKHENNVPTVPKSAYSVWVPQASQQPNWTERCPSGGSACVCRAAPSESQPFGEPGLGSIRGEAAVPRTPQRRRRRPRRPQPCCAM